MPYEVTAPELQVLQAVGEFHDPVTGELTAYDHRANLYLDGEIVPDDRVSPIIRQALEDADESNPTYRHLKGKLRRVGSTEEEKIDAVRRLGLPLENYDELDEDEVVAALRILSGPLVAAIKEHESNRPEPRERILEYDAGRREAQDDRLKGTIGSDRDDATEGPTAKIQTREVTENDVVQGEGVKGGQPVRPRGKAKAKESAKAESPAPPRRQGRQPAKDDDKE